MTVGCLSLIILQLSKSALPKERFLPAVAFSMGAVGYLLVDWNPMDTYWGFYLLLIPAYWLPFTFWLFSRSIFEDHFRLRPWMAWGLVMVVLLQFLFFLNHRYQLLGESDDVAPIIWMLPRAVSLLFVVLGIISSTRNREADLILARLQFRRVFLFLTAAIIVLTLISEIAFQEREAPIWLELIQKGVIAGLTFYFAYRQLTFTPSFFVEASAPPQVSSPATPPLDKQLVRKLEDLMDIQEVWRTEGLTIRLLSEKMEEKEYKLRRTINQHLGFRNFNDFLHSYRIQEACKLLADPQNKEMTILEIAYGLGYHSLAPFNKAFKAQTGTTPTRWRKSQAV